MPSATFRPVQAAAGPRTPIASGGRTRKESQHPLPPSSAAPPADVDFIRIATPEPVAGRTHCTVQTDTYLEDLRRNKHADSHEFATQTDAENDRPTPPLFVPRSSGEDVATEVESGALFDFDLEVEAVLGVLVEKSLDQSLQEVCEEEELAELDHHRATFQQEKNQALAAVQQAVARDQRRQAERERRRAQEAERLAAEKAASEKRAAATLAKRLVSSMESSVLRKLDASGAFYDPVRREVEKEFMPLLLAQTAQRLAEHQTARDALDDVMRHAIEACRSTASERADEEAEARVKDLVAHLLDPATIPRPIEGVVARATRVGIVEETTARAAAHGVDSLASSSAAAVQASPEERAHLIVSRILAERAAQRAADEKRARDILTIQSLQRGRVARARVAVLAEKRRRAAERAAMSPLELLVSLRTYAGFEVRPAPAVSPSESGEVDADVADALASGQPLELVVSSIAPGSPASESSLVLGDQIISLNGTPLTSSAGVTPEALKALQLNPGDALRLQVRRLTTDGRAETVALELATDEDGYDRDTVRDLRESAELPPVSSDARWASAEEARESVEKLPAKLGATPVDQKGGVRLTKLGVDSAAARAGLTEGDIVVAVNGVPVGDAKVFAARLKDLRAGDVVDLELLSSASLEKVQAGAAITLRTMTTVRKPVELGGGAKAKLTIEAVRGLRRTAGLTVFGETN